MKYYLILMFFIAYCSSGSAQTRLECIDCSKMPKSACAACDQYGATAEYFSGLLITKGGRSTQIYRPYQIWTRGNTAYVNDWRGTLESISLSQTNYGTMYNLINALTECLCSGGSSEHHTDETIIGDGSVGNPYRVDTLNIMATKYDLETMGNLGTQDLTANENRTFTYDGVTFMLLDDDGTPRAMFSNAGELAQFLSKDLDGQIGANNQGTYMSHDNVASLTISDVDGRALLTDNRGAGDRAGLEYSTLDYDDYTPYTHAPVGYVDSTDIHEGAHLLLNNNGGTTVTYNVEPNIGVVVCEGNSVNGVWRINLDTFPISSVSVVSLLIVNNTTQATSTISVYYKNVLITTLTNASSAAIATTKISVDNWVVKKLQNPDYVPSGGTGGIYSASGTIANACRATIPAGQTFTIQYGNLTTDCVTFSRSTESVDFFGEVIVDKSHAQAGGVEIDVAGLATNESPTYDVNWNSSTEMLEKSTHINWTDSLNQVMRLNPNTDDVQRVNSSAAFGQRAQYTATNANLFRNGSNLQITWVGTITGDYIVGDVIYVDFTADFTDGFYTIATKPGANIMTLSGTSGGFYSSGQPGATGNIGEDKMGNVTVTDTLFLENPEEEDTPTKLATWDPTSKVVEVSDVYEVVDTQLVATQNRLDSVQALLEAQIAAGGGGGDRRISGRDTVFIMFDDLCNNSGTGASTTLGDYGKTSVVVSTGGASNHRAAFAADTMDYRNPGIVELNSGTTSNSTGYALLGWYNRWYLIDNATGRGGDFNIEWMVYTNSTMGSSVDMGYFIGFGSSSSTVATDDIIAFHYDSDVSDNWSIISDSTGTQTSVDLGALYEATANTWFKLGISWTLATRTLDFYIDGDLVHSIVNENIPNMFRQPLAKVHKNNTTITAQRLFVDYFYVDQKIDRRL